jgi:hypothetical protein
MPVSQGTGSTELSKLFSGDWTFFEKCSGRRPLLPLESPERASESSPGPARGQEPLAPPRVSVPTHCLLSPESPAFGRFGGRGRVRGVVADSPVWCFDILSMSLGTKHDLRKRARSCPLTLPSPPTQKTFLREREQMVGLVTQGAPSGSCPGGALGYRLTPRWGSIKKKRLLPLHSDRRKIASGIRRYWLACS